MSSVNLKIIFNRKRRGALEHAFHHLEKISDRAGRIVHCVDYAGNAVFIPAMSPIFQYASFGSSRLLPAAGLALLLAMAGCATHGPKPEAGTSIPQIARIAGVQIGYSTQDDLEKAWGEGLTVVGGHPNSGRRWRVRDTDWVVATDGFLYSDRGLVIDGLQIESQQADEASQPEDPEFRHSTNAPFAKLDKKAFAWLGEISRGMTRLEVITALNRQALKFKETGGDLFVEANGFSAITSEANANRHLWQARLAFQEGKLSRLQIEAD